MKITYVKLIIAQINDAVLTAAAEGRTIEKIVLTAQEYLTMKDQWGEMNGIPLPAAGYPESINGIPVEIEGLPQPEEEVSFLGWINETNDKAASGLLKVWSVCGTPKPTRLSNRDEWSIWCLNNSLAVNKLHELWETYIRETQP